MAEARLSLYVRAALWAGLIAADTSAQLFFKAAALRLDEPRFEPRWVLMVAQSPLVWAALACLLMTFAIWMLILRSHDLSQAFPVTSLSVVCVVAASGVLFSERIAPTQLAGIAIIVAGVALLRSEPEPRDKGDPSTSR